MDYKKLLEHSYATSQEMVSPFESRLEFLSEEVFDFDTYDGEMACLFARKAIEVCNAINSGSTYEYITDLGSYQWFLIMCNIPFFKERIEWGCSIRGAWWKNEPIAVNSCGLWEDYEQILRIEFSVEQWRQFISAIIEFSKEE